MDSSFQKISEGIDVQPLLNKLKSFPLLWGEITARQQTPGSAHAHTRAIFLRWAKELSIHATFNDLKAVNYPALKVLEDEAVPLVDKIFLNDSEHARTHLIVDVVAPKYRREREAWVTQ